MKKYFQWMFLAGLFLLNSCSNTSGSNINNNVSADNVQLSAQQFSDKIKQLSGAIIIDVRTPEEFQNGHIQNAVNIDVAGDNFENELAKLNKLKPVFVYCLSGGRSAAATEKMLSAGFKNIYELKGGILSWRSAGLPETAGTAATTAPLGITMAQFNDLLKSDKLVLIDFYADWCAPCKLMKPSIEEIKLEMNKKVQVISINADENKSLLSTLGIEALPTLLVYKNGVIIWKNIGYTNKQTIINHLQ